MRTVVAHRRPVDGAELERTQPPALEADPTLSDVLVVDEDGGPLLAVTRLDRDWLAAARRAALVYAKRASTTYRASGIRNVSRTFGFLSPATTMRRDGCRSCNGATEDPEAHATLCETARWLTVGVREALPDQALQAEERSAVISPDWRLGGSWWTSGVLNIDSAMPYHRDGNNLPGVWSSMIVFRRGTAGGHLHLPELDLVLPLRDGDVLTFPGPDLWHGVTPIERTQRDGYRMTAVYYTVAAMSRCGDPAEEAVVTAARRTEREAGIAAQLAPEPELPPVERMTAAYLVGQPGAGKSRLLRGLTENLRATPAARPFAHVVYHDDDGPAAAQLGGAHETFPGTDRLSMSVQPVAEEWVRRRPYPVLVGEGDRLATAGFLDALAGAADELTVVHLDVPDEVAEERRAGRGTEQRASWVAGRRTKVRRLLDGREHVTLDGTLPPEELLRQAIERVPAFAALAALA